MDVIDGCLRVNQVVCWFGCVGLRKGYACFFGWADVRRIEVLFVGSGDRMSVIVRGSSWALFARVSSYTSKLYHWYSDIYHENSCHQSVAFDVSSP